MPRARQKSGSLKFNDELDVAIVPQDALTEEVSLIFSPATADELAAQGLARQPQRKFVYRLLKRC